MATRTVILLALAAATLAFFAIPALKANPRFFNGQSGSINLIGY